MAPGHIKGVAHEGREAMFLHLFDGIGTAGPTALASTSKEVVGATGNAGVIMQDKSFTLQDDEKDNNVAGARNVACTAHIIPAFSRPSCGPKSKRETAIFCCGAAFPFPPARANKVILLSEVMIFNWKQIIKGPEEFLTRSAVLIRSYIDPVIAYLLPNFETGPLRDLPLHPKLHYHFILYTLGSQMLLMCHVTTRAHQ